MTHLYKNIKINYNVFGTGSAVVLLHGFLENSTMWKNIVPELSKKNKIIVIDLLGHGKSENLGYMHTMEEQAAMVKDVLKSLKLRKFKLIGHSMGGYIALAFAKLFPEATKGICLMNATAYPDTAEKQKNRDRAIIAVKQNAEMFIKISIPQLFSEDHRTALKNEINQTTQEALSTSKQGIIAALEGMKIRKKRIDTLNNSRFKNMIILGEDDPVLNFNGHKTQIQSDTVEFIKLPFGHMSHIETPKQLMIALKKFIN